MTRRAIPGTLLVAILLSGTGAKPTYVNSIDDAFRAYSAGDYAGAAGSLRDQLKSREGLEEFRRLLSRRVDVWPAPSAAAFALEASVVAVAARPNRPGVIVEILEAGCRRLRSTKGNSIFELRWHLAGLAFFLGPGSSLRGYGVEDPNPVGVLALHPHLRHAIERFPTDVDLRLDWGTIQEVRAHVWLYTWAVTGAGRRRGGSTPPRSDLQRGWLQAAATAFEAVRSDPKVGIEATLRLGRVKWLQGESENALGLWAELERPALDPSIRYLIQIFRGRALTDLARRRDAEAAYRKALGLLPNRQSASIPLAALLYSTGDTEQAAQLVEAMLNSPDPPDDPWPEYLEPGHAVWPSRLDAMRRELRR
jgi:tetratricopeptide (TPR) repeat protein